MPNHYHLQLELGCRPSLSAAMHWLNTGYGIWFNRRYRRQGALFQGRYRAILFDADECLFAVHYYIHLNPVRVGILKAVGIGEGAVDKTLLVKRRERLREYEWSSYRDYAGLRWTAPARSVVDPGDGARERRSIGGGISSRAE
jgi:hypothetical protein